MADKTTMTTQTTPTQPKAAKTPAEERGEFNTSPDRPTDPYSTSEAAKQATRKAQEAAYEASIAGQELPPSYETEQEIAEEREAEAKKAQAEAAKPDSYTQAQTAGQVGQPTTSQSSNSGR